MPHHAWEQRPELDSVEIPFMDIGRSLCHIFARFGLDFIDYL
jgi:hypothetical protein